MTAPKLIAAMRARRGGLLACGHFVPAGQFIVKLGAGRWACAPCRLAELDGIRRTMTEPPRPGRGATEEETA